MSSFNKVILLGNLTRDPEIRYTSDKGVPYAQFALAVNERYRQGDETKEAVNYIDIVVYGKQAENCGKYIFKGDSVLIEGKFRQRRWDDKETGQARQKIEVIANPVGGVTFMPKRQNHPTHPPLGKGRGEEGSVPPNVSGVFPDAEQVGEDGIPF